VLEAVGDHPQSERLDMSHGFILSRAVREHAGQLDDLGEPATVALLLKLDAEMDRQGDLLKTLRKGYYGPGPTGRVTLLHLTLQRLSGAPLAFMVTERLRRPLETPV